MLFQFYFWAEKKIICHIYVFSQFQDRHGTKKTLTAIGRSEDWHWWSGMPSRLPGKRNEPCIGRSLSNHGYLRINKTNMGRFLDVAMLAREMTSWWHFVQTNFHQGLQLKVGLLVIKVSGIFPKSCRYPNSITKRASHKYACDAQSFSTCFIMCYNYTGLHGFFFK